jgi:hypothetical protein
LIGEIVVTIDATPDGYGDAVNLGVFVTPAEIKMTFSEFLSKLEMEKKDRSGVYYAQ